MSVRMCHNSFVMPIVSGTKVLYKRSCIMTSCSWVLDPRISSCKMLLVIQISSHSFAYFPTMISLVGKKTCFLSPDNFVLQPSSLKILIHCFILRLHLKWGSFSTGACWETWSYSIRTWKSLHDGTFPSKRTVLCADAAIMQLENFLLLVIYY